MFENVVQRLLDDAVEGDFAAGRQEAVQFAEIACVNWIVELAATLSIIATSAVRKSELVEMRRAQVVRDRPHLFERLRDRVTERM